MAWHGNCYRPRIGDNFPIAKLAAYDDDNEGDIHDKTETEKFMKARNGDNFLCPFQCDLCHFRNVTGRNPGLKPENDRKLLIGLRRANLDAFWSRAPSTVLNNTRGLKKLWTIGTQTLGLEKVLPEMGPFPLEDTWGMHMATIILIRSLDKGIYQDTIQFETARKLRSVYSNCWGASVHTLTQGVMARDTMKTYVTSCPTYSLWFERFIKGLHSRMGDDRRPDLAICSPLMKEIINIVNVDYMEELNPFKKQFIARAGLFYLSAFFGGLRGEEVNRVLRKYFINLNEESMALSSKPHCVLPLFGNFKGEQGIPRCYLRRVVAKSKSGLDIGIWVERVSLYEKDSKTRYLFANPDGSKEKAGKYETYLFQTLEVIQLGMTGLIPVAIKVREVYGISRSFRRGATTEATNADNRECNSKDIERNNRWRTEDRANTKYADLDMLQLYTDTLQSVDAELKFSRVL